MGCVCAKGIPKAERDEKIRHSTKRLVGPSKKDEDVVIGDNAGNDVTTRLILHFPADETAVSSPVSPDEREKKDVIAVKPRLLGETPVDVRANGGQPQPLTLSKMTTSPSHRTEAGPVLTGWPPWLSAVAGEAISGWAPRKAESFEKLEKIGQGTYSSVYKARDLETGKIVALKKVRFTRMDPESVRFMAREIIILRKLDHPNVMKLEGLITSKVSGSLYLVFEYMEHDLAGLAASPGTKFTEAQIKCFIQQLLCGLEYCHCHGVLHRDIKGANLLIDNNGILKIADFGLATLFNSNQKQPMTSRVVTLWYRPPELLLGSTNYGPAVDLWSAGCILAELFSGKPIMPGRTEVEQLHKIFKLCGSPSEEFWKKSKLPHATIFKPQRPYRCCISKTFKDLPSSALALVEVLLAIEPENRGLASSALHSELFTTHPLPCDPASLPKCPPSKEFDAKIRNEEAKKRRAANNGRTQESKRRVSGESEAVAAPNANAELPASIQIHGQSNAKCRSEVLVVAAHAGADLPESFKGTSHSVLSHSSRSVRYNEVGSSRQKNATIINMEEDPTGSRGLLNSSGNDPEIGAQKSFSGQRAAQFSRLSSSGVQGNSRFDSNAANSHWFGDRFSGKYNRLDDADLLDRPKSSQRKGDQPSRKESMMGSAVTNRFHYSGPLLAPDRNVEEMLKEHEKQIQHAVRKARQDNLNSKKIHNDTGLAGSLLHYRRNGN